jgi:hypothetical protein
MGSGMRKIAMPNSKCPHCGKTPGPILLDTEHQIVYCPNEQKIHSGVIPECEICDEIMTSIAIEEDDGIEYCCAKHRTIFRPKKPELHVDETALEEAKNRYRINMKTAYAQSDEKIARGINGAEAEGQTPEEIVLLLQKGEGRMKTGSFGLSALRALMLFGGGIVGMALWSILTKRRKQKAPLLPLLGPLPTEQKSASLALTRLGTKRGL